MTGAPLDLVERFYAYRSFEHRKCQTPTIIADIAKEMGRRLRIIEVSCGPGVFAGILCVELGSAVESLLPLDYEESFLRLARETMEPFGVALDTAQFDLNAPATFPRAKTRPHRFHQCSVPRSRSLIVFLLRVGDFGARAKWVVGEPSDVRGLERGSCRTVRRTAPGPHAEGLARSPRSRAESPFPPRCEIIHDWRRSRVRRRLRRCGLDRRAACAQDGRVRIPCRENLADRTFGYAGRCKAVMQKVFCGSRSSGSAITSQTRSCGRRRWGSKQAPVRG